MQSFVKDTSVVLPEFLFEENYRIPCGTTTESNDSNSVRDDSIQGSLAHSLRGEKQTGVYFGKKVKRRGCTRQRYLQEKLV